MDLQDALNFDDLAGFESTGSTAYSSPSGLFDMNAVVGPSGFTVSPQELFRDFSAPNSSALTNLTSPSLYNGSPDFDSFEVSPNLNSNDFSAGAADPWFPLFPQETPTAVEEEPSKPSPATSSSDDAASEKKSRRKSGNSPTSAHARHSSVSGVNAKRRDKPLPPIVVEDAHDTVAMKRARNTLAARKSRERKAQKLEDLEEKIQQLEQDRDYWKERYMALAG